jgi:hypothetical protein
MIEEKLVFERGFFSGLPKNKWSEILIDFDKLFSIISLTPKGKFSFFCKGNKVRIVNKTNGKACEIGKNKLLDKDWLRILFDDLECGGD